MGLILQNTADYNLVRDQLGFPIQELTDGIIQEDEFLGAAEAWVMQRVPDWQLILALTPPLAPVLAAPLDAASQLPAASYIAALVARVGATASPLGATAAQAVAAGQALSVTAPAAPGITSYDGYVGVLAGVLFLQGALTGMSPGATVLLESFALVGTASGTLTSPVRVLRAATAAICCSFLCRRFQKAAPKALKTQTYEEQFDHDWREEAARYLADANRYLGMLPTYSVPPASAFRLAHPAPQPYDPRYAPGSNPLALPPGA